MIGITHLLTEQEHSVVNITIRAVAFPDDINGSYQELHSRLDAAIKAAFKPGPPPTVEEIYEEIHRRKITL